MLRVVKECRTLLRISSLSVVTCPASMRRFVQRTLTIAYVGHACDNKNILEKTVSLLLQRSAASDGCCRFGQRQARSSGGGVRVLLLSSVIFALFTATVDAVPDTQHWAILLFIYRQKSLSRPSNPPVQPNCINNPQSKIDTTRTIDPHRSVALAPSSSLPPPLFPGHLRILTVVLLILNRGNAVHDRVF